MSKSEQQKKLLIEQLKKTPIVQMACEKTGVARSTYYRWKKQNKTFAKEAEEAIVAGELFIRYGRSTTTLRHSG